MRLRSGGLLLTCAVLLLALVVAPPASARRHTCKMIQSKTVVNTRTTRIFVRYFDERGRLIASPVDHSSIYVYVCRHDIGHRLILAAGDGAGDYPYRVAVTGDQVAMAFGSGFEGCKGDTLIKVFNTRTAEQKKALFRRIAELLGENPGIRPEDVFVNVLDAAKENWSVGHGLAQFA